MTFLEKQAGNGPNRRPAQSLKRAKCLKYSVAKTSRKVPLRLVNSFRRHAHTHFLYSQALIHYATGAFFIY